MTTTTKPTITLNASTLASEWETYLLDRIFQHEFWSAVDGFVEERFDDMNDSEREKIHTFIQEKTQVIIKSPSFELDTN